MQKGKSEISICNYGNEVFNDMYDAMNGLVLLGDGNGDFILKKIPESGFFVPGGAKALIKLRGVGNKILFAASQNRGPMKIFMQKDTSLKLISLQPTDKTAIITLANGRQRKEELYLGNSFLSQSSRFLNVSDNIVSVQVINYNGQVKKISL